VPLGAKVQPDPAVNGMVSNGAFGADNGLQTNLCRTAQADRFRLPSLALGMTLLPQTGH
jgi:hypothetical protein